ncbi:hypothetical protein C8A00DRAFT_40207 [Chaetomidium leptoderma]|uniref:ATP-grasp domain-containing protein n=1 Tax=Chaetomidium leptoderma TaxID=669021 RepID=A0AAN6VU60_9PEZI|nr:hypothetical protein C8A00DRAFT_40207 [Chaetomidium leptoderma]
MGSVGGRASPGVKLPTVKLDTTLVELYKRACPKDTHTRLGWVSCGVTSGIDLTPDFPRNTKFVYEDQAFIATPHHELNNGNGRLQRSLAKKYLSHIPQRDAFISGNTPVVLFNLGQTPEQIEHDRREAEATISVLDPSQRPELIFCPGPSKIPMKEHKIDKLEYKVTVDGLEDYPLTHDLETHWHLNSKAALARSGLPTPKSDIIETEGYPPAAGACCNLCTAAAKDTSRLPTIPPGCTGPRGEWLSSQTNRILDAIRARPVPFVFKTQQAFGGAGTWLVTSADHKAKLLTDLSGSTTGSEGGGLLRKLLSLLTPANAHLHPTTTLLTDLIPTPQASSNSSSSSSSSDYGLTFCVPSSGGKPHFLAAAEQILTTDGSSAWVGSTIAYARQDELHDRFSGLMEQVAAWVAQRGYVGLVGVDVLLPDSKEEDGLVVDLNVRTCGSVSLALLRGHFFTERGLGWAGSFSIAVRGGRKGFVEKWRGLFEEGRMVILSWYEDVGGGESIADVVVGAEDQAGLGELMGRVKEGTEEVTF